MKEKLKNFTKELLRIWKLDNALTSPVIIGKIDRLTDEEIKKTDELLKNYC